MPMLASTDLEGPVVQWGGGIHVPVYVEFWGSWLEPNNNTCWQTPASYSINRNTKSLGFQCNIPSWGSSGAWRECSPSVSTVAYPTSAWFSPASRVGRGTSKLRVQVLRVLPVPCWKRHETVLIYGGQSGITNDISIPCWRHKNSYM